MARGKGVISFPFAHSSRNDHIAIRPRERGPGGTNVPRRKHKGTCNWERRKEGMQTRNGKNNLYIMERCDAYRRGTFVVEEWE